jgi:hypothetical protein
VLLAVSLYTSISVTLTGAVVVGTAVVGTAVVGIVVAVGVAVGVPTGWVVHPLSTSNAASTMKTDTDAMVFFLFHESGVMQYRISSRYINRNE